MRIGLGARFRTAELMDDPGLPTAEHRLALAGLTRINAWSRSAAVLWPALRKLAAETPGQPLRVLDVASGAGDVPIRLQKLAIASGINLSVEGCDLSPTAVDHANLAAEEAGVRFFVHDVLYNPLPDGYDAVTCSLFLHHLSDDEAVLVLRQMAKAGRVVLVNDLVRSRISLIQVWVACHFLSRSPVVHFDGPASVRAAFTLKEAEVLAHRAGLVDVKVARRRPCRFLLTGRAG